MAGAKGEYTLASSGAERARLARQAERIRPATERLFRTAEIGPGACVLDVGSGAGDVALLVAQLVGESGSVVGVDRDQAQLDTAARRCAEAGFANVRFDVADLHDPPPGPFDAIVGRFVLMYQPDPDAAVRMLATRLVPGGTMAFLELALPLGDETSGALSWPEHRLVPCIRSWISAAFAATGVTPLMGLRLRGAFRAAGLEPQDPVEGFAIVYSGREAAEMTTGLVRSMLPVIIEHNIATEADVNIDSLADRIVEAAGDEELVYSLPLGIAAWARKPESG
jgi:ubiquinone/menaquinone biosynthesis C-methylase UbiE